MTPERWHRVRSVFAEALDLDPEARRVALDEACADDAELRREIEALLEASDLSEGFLEADGSTATDAGGDERRLGAYRLVRPIGRGGMGTVYLAVRADETFERRVAIKLMAQHLQDGDLVRRFRTERQILAALDHPHIAQLLDGGTTPEGLPYLVMEYVEGVPIDRYCADHDLSVDQRIRLFLDLCSAVQFAHHNLVVHRDLKPANVLVDEQGHLKLLDFGIAKLLNPALAGRDAAPTVASLMALTPEYASPEQLTGDPVTTASDVYALGVVLHRLLGGDLPYRITQRAPAEIFRAICEDPPRLASETAASVGGPGSARRSRRLRGDLDNIVRMALAKRPQRRYVSPEHLAEDLRRHLDGRPVSARPATWSYRAGKFVRRHPWGVAATVALVVASLWFAVATARQNAEVERQRDRAEQAKELLVDIFQSSDPLEFEDGTEPTLRDVLDRGAARLETDLSDQPEVRAELLGVLGVVYRHLGDAANAERLAEEALALLGRSSIDESRLVATLRNDLAAARITTGRYQEAAELYRETLARHGDDRPDEVVAAAHDGLGGALFHLRDLDAAEQEFRRALDLRRQILGPAHVDTATSQSHLGSVLFRGGQLEEAETLHRETLELRRRTLGEDHVEVAQSLHDLAAVLTGQGRLDEARELFEQSIALRTKILGDGHPKVAVSLHEFGYLLERAGDDAGAENMYRRALGVHRQARGERHPNVGQTLANLGSLLRRRGELDEAAQLLREAAEIFAVHLGPEHSDVLATRINAARVDQLAGRLATAEAAYRQILDAAGDRLPDHRIVALEYLAEALVDQGEPAAAEPMAREAVDLAAGRSGAEHWRTAAARALLAKSLLALGEREEAAAENERALPILADAAPVAARHYLAITETTRAALAEDRSVQR